MTDDYHDKILCERLATTVDHGICKCFERHRIAALEAELAVRTRERDELRYEKRARSAIDPNERLHNLCDGLAESRRESPYDQESWDLADACNRELQAERDAERERRMVAEEMLRDIRDSLPVGMWPRASITNHLDRYKD